MLHAYLITGADLPRRIAQAESIAQTKLEPAPDILIIKPEPEPSIGINKIRQLERFLSRKTYQADQKIVFIPQAETLTLPSQNALLKTLEEPSPHSLIILTAPHRYHFLPTVVSRCQTISLISTAVSLLTPEEQKKQKQIFSQISQAGLGERINLAQQYSLSKDLALNFCQQQLFFLYHRPAKQKINLRRLIRRLSQTSRWLDANLNPRLCLENLFIHYPKA
jgi:hypothetical protein